jgi:hypothetical protein
MCGRRRCGTAARTNNDWPTGRRRLKGSGAQGLRGSGAQGEEDDSKAVEAEGTEEEALKENRDAKRWGRSRWMRRTGKLPLSSTSMIHSLMCWVLEWNR